MNTFLRFIAAAASACMLVVATATTVAAQDFKVIVNSGNPITEITSAALSKIFLKETLKFPSGAAATPVDQSKSSSVRAAFSKQVVGRPVSAIDTYWQQQIFSGKEIPPATKASDDDIVAFVKATPGAIGYVGGSANTGGVKVIDVK